MRELPMKPPCGGAEAGEPDAEPVHSLKRLRRGDGCRQTCPQSPPTFTQVVEAGKHRSAADME